MTSKHSLVSNPLVQLSLAQRIRIYSLFPSCQPFSAEVKPEDLDDMIDMLEETHERIETLMTWNARLRTQSRFFAVLFAVMSVASLSLLIALVTS